MKFTPGVYLPQVKNANLSIPLAQSTTVHMFKTHKRTKYVILQKDALVLPSTLSCAMQEVSKHFVFQNRFVVKDFWRIQQETWVLQSIRFPTRSTLTANGSFRVPQTRQFKACCFSALQDLALFISLSKCDQWKFDLYVHSFCFSYLLKCGFLMLDNIAIFCEWFFVNITRYWSKQFCKFTQRHK